MKKLKWIVPSLAILFLIGVFGFSSSFVTHPNVGHSFNENPAALYKDNHGMDISKFITKEQAVKRVVIPGNATTKSAKLEKWADHLVEDKIDKEVVNNQIESGRQVWVVKTSFPDGIDTKAGFYKNATLTSVFDAQTGTLLESAVTGDYQGRTK
jgi:hypothetical protein